MSLLDTLMPRALPKRRHSIAVALTPSELHKLILCHERDAQEAIEAGRDDFADFLLCRVAELREAAR